MTDQLFATPAPLVTPEDGPAERLGRWVLHRAGILNVWQYDRVELRFAGGRALLRGKNGAGKSKALEVLLPFLLDGDTRSIDASGRDRTTVWWLMTDQRDPGHHVGYAWLELRCTDTDGTDHFCTLGAGMKASTATRQTSVWYFLTEEARIGVDLQLEEAGECLSIERLKAALGDGVTTSAAEHRRRVASRLFGLRDDGRYRNLLHLLHRLRDPNVGNRIDAGDLVAVLGDSLPPPADAAIDAAAERFEGLEQVHDQLDRSQRSADALGRFLVAYRSYAGAALGSRADAVLGADQALRKVRRLARQAADASDAARAALENAEAEVRSLEEERASASAELEGLRQSEAYKQHQQLSDRRAAVEGQRAAAAAAEHRAHAAVEAATETASDVEEALARRAGEHEAAALARSALVRLAALAGVDAAVLPALPAIPSGTDLSTAGNDLTTAGTDLVTGGTDLVTGGTDLASDGFGPRIAAARREVVVAVDAATDRRRRAHEVAGLARQAVDRRQAAAQADEAAAISEGQLQTRRAEADAAGKAWVDASDAWRSAVLAWPGPAAAESYEIDLSYAHRLLSEGPADAGELDAVRSSAIEALGPATETARRAEALALAARDRVEESLQTTDYERRQVESTEESHPEPPSRRDAERDPAAGAPFYELVDFSPGLDDAGRAGIEAALEAAGLLDAWVGADGLVLHPATHDVIVRAGVAPAPPGFATLADVLVASPAAEAPVEAATVDRILRSMALGPVTGGPVTGGPVTVGPVTVGPVTGDPVTGEPVTGGPVTGGPVSVGPVDASAGAGSPEPESPTIAGAQAACWVAPDGRWGMGVLQGAWSKAQPEYLGVATRRATRLRRLAALAARCDELRQELAESEVVLGAARERRSELEALPAGWPDGQATREAAAEAAARRQVASEAAARHEHDLDAAERARTAAAAAIAELQHAAAADSLPTGIEDLEGVVSAARQLGEAIERWGLQLDEIGRRHDVLGHLQARHARRTADAADAADAAGRLGAVYRRAAEELAAVEDAIGATVQQVLDAVSDSEGRLRYAEGRLPEATKLATRSVAIAATAEEKARQAGVDVDRVLETLLAAAARLYRALLLPGISSAALGRELVAPTDLLGEGAAPDPETVAVAVARAVSAVREETPGGEAVGDAAILHRYDELQEALAGGYDVAIDEDDGVKFVHVADDTGRRPLPAVAERVRREAESVRDRLVADEREIIERFLLGELGEELRERLQEAAELVHEANAALGRVRTSHGKGAHLVWHLDPDAPEAARVSSELLQMSPRSESEDERLRAALLELIQAERSAEPSAGYGDHLRAALDYREWYRFVVQVVDDAAPGSSRVLSSRLGLSQGEQRVLSYLALFAAASAHFAALGRDAPEGRGVPRLLLLDDAFAKVDEPTHGRLLELLVELDLDFLLTSERLWGCFPTVPSLEIYEALREPSRPGVALAHFHWDGARRHLVGL